MRRHGLPRSRRIFRQYRRSQSGVTAIEFAMVAPPFFALMMAIFEVGIMLFSEYVIEHGVGKASRMIRTGEVQAVPMNATQFRTLVCGNLASYLECETDLHIDVRAFANFDDVVGIRVDGVSRVLLGHGKGIALFDDDGQLLGALAEPGDRGASPVSEAV